MADLGFGNPKYWDYRYAQEKDEDIFDWLESYQSLKLSLGEFLTDKSMKILVVGCGNAKFSEDLYDDGFTNVVNNDISDVVIQKMAKRNKEKRPEMQWLTMDCTNMWQFQANTFDLVIDKSTIDAIVCGDDANLKVAQMLAETIRVLKVGGVAYTISFGKPKERGYHFHRPFLSWDFRNFIVYDADCKTEAEKEERSHQIYTGKKRADADEVLVREYENCLTQMGYPFSASGSTQKLQAQMQGQTVAPPKQEKQASEVSTVAEKEETKEETTEVDKMEEWNRKMADLQSRYQQILERERELDQEQKRLQEQDVTQPSGQYCIQELPSQGTPSQIEQISAGIAQISLEEKKLVSPQQKSQTKPIHVTEANVDQVIKQIQSDSHFSGEETKELSSSASKEPRQTKITDFFSKAKKPAQSKLTDFFKKK